MFDLGWSEMMVVGILALIIIGPKDLPKVFKQVSYWVRQLRGMASEFRSGVDEMVRDADLEDAKKIFDTASEFNPKNQFKNLVDPKDEMSKELDIEADLGPGFETPSKELFEELTASDSDKTEASATKTPVTKKTTPKKTTAKTTAAKKPVAKKAASTKAAPKKKAPAKTPAKKSAPKAATKPVKPKA